MFSHKRRPARKESQLAIDYREEMASFVLDSLFVLVNGISSMVLQKVRK